MICAQIAKLALSISARRSFGASVDRTPGILIAGSRQLVKIRADVRLRDSLDDVIKVFKHHQIELYSVVSKTPTGIDAYEFEISFDASKNGILWILEENFRSLDIHFGVEAPLDVPWFPLIQSDLDFIGNKKDMTMLELTVDHPGYKDKAYKSRRDLIANQTLGYKMADPIPDVPYAAEETALWNRIYPELRRLHKHFAPQEYKEQIEKMENLGLLKESEIPQLEKLNQYLKATTNWRLKPVAGHLKARDFLNTLAFRTFCSSQYIRHPTVPDYTPEPDIIHEVIGHAVSFAIPRYCEISQALGILSLGATDYQIQLLGAVYGYLLEFGLCSEGKDIKFFGAGQAGSTREIIHANQVALCHPDKIIKLDLKNNLPTKEFKMQDVQDSYYIGSSFEDCLNQLEYFCQSMNKSFNVKYDAKKNSIEPDRAILMKPFNSGH